MSTLRLLTAIESDLGDLGRKVEAALRIMVTGGTPESLLADVMFVEMLKACREVLKVKLDVGGMSLNQQVRAMGGLASTYFEWELGFSEHSLNFEMPKIQDSRYILAKFGPNNMELQRSFIRNRCDIS